MSNIEPPSKRSMGHHFKELWLILKMIMHKLFSLQGTTDIEGTIDNITRNISIRGTNMWMLISSSVLASVGLDMNSGAILIGAMLISPLMSPIIGMGFSLGTHDRNLFFMALNNLLITVVISLVFSSVYFYMTPLGEITDQLRSRTSPTLLDAIVAIFGGVAGIVACSRTKSLNAIPGVAIATALMPPLCTAGYGIAKGDLGFFMGAFYLFFINALFITAVTYFMVQLLGFPHKHFFEKNQRNKVKIFTIIACLTTLIPSIFFLGNLVKEQKIKAQVNEFVTREINTSLHEAVEWKLEDKGQGGKRLKVYMIGSPVTPEQESLLKEKLIGEAYELDFVNLHIVQMNVPKEKAEKEDSIVVKELISTMEQVKKRDEEIAQLKLAALKVDKDARLLPNLDEEVALIFPEIDRAWYGLMLPMDSSAKKKEVPTLMLTFKRGVKEQFELLESQNEIQTNAQEVEDEVDNQERMTSEEMPSEQPKPILEELSHAKKQDIIQRLRGFLKKRFDKESLHILEYDPTQDMNLVIHAADQMEWKEEQGKEAGNVLESANQKE
ncbi:MAG: TIGR00341 family protein [Verrucomicrobiota bacterium]